MSKSIYILKSTLIILLLILYVITGFYYYKLPDKFYLTKEEILDTNSFFKISITETQKGVVPAYADNKKELYETFSLNLFGLIKIKDIEVERIERPNLIPCGTPFGIKMITNGAIVTGFGNVDGEFKTRSPAKDSGIQAGDVIKKVNGISISKNSDISSAVQMNKFVTRVILERNGEIIRYNFKPEISLNEGIAKIGLWVRDSSAGIGTITFFNPDNGTFGGLGHGVCDIDTGKLLPLSKGEAISVAISNIVKGQSGIPGELGGSFLSRIPIGIITSNSEAGVFGTANYPISIEKSIPMAFKQDVKIGKATILTTVNGNSPKEFDILIEKIDYNEENQVKNMVIRICDTELINLTGGIVQGMSGSPIIQNGKLAGAITHVFVKDSKRGYAIFAENMYRNSLSEQNELPINKCVA